MISIGQTQSSRRQILPRGFVYPIPVLSFVPPMLIASSHSPDLLCIEIYFLLSLLVYESIDQDAVSKWTLRT